MQHLADQPGAGYTRALNNLLMKTRETTITNEMLRNAHTKLGRLRVAMEMKFIEMGLVGRVSAQAGEGGGRSRFLMESQSQLSGA